VNCRDAVIVRMRAPPSGQSLPFGRTTSRSISERRFGALWQERPRCSHSHHRKNETPTNSISESMP
jgi:hypothetical protein